MLRPSPPSQVWLAPPSVSPPHGVHPAAVLPVEPAGWTHHLSPGDCVRVTDLRGKVREWTVVSGGHEGDDHDRGGRLAECWKTTYVESGTGLAHIKEGALPVGSRAASERPMSWFVLHPIRNFCS